MHPTLYNLPLPLSGMKPQPLAVTIVIAKRRRVGERQLEKIMAEDLERERLFEERLEKLVRGQYRFGHFNEWVDSLHHILQDIYQAMSHSKACAARSYSPEMLATIKQARRGKIADKARELERKRRGEVLGRTIRRRNKGPLALVDSDERGGGAWISVSEAGYIGLVKRRLGFRLRDPEAWKAKGGREPENDKTRVGDPMMRGIEENERRMGRRRTRMM